MNRSMGQVDQITQRTATASEELAAAAAEMSAQADALRQLSDFFTLDDSVVPKLPPRAPRPGAGRRETSNGNGNGNGKARAVTHMHSLSFDGSAGGDRDFHPF